MNVMQNVNLNQLGNFQIDTFTGLLEFLSFILWPLIYIASKALTNDFIYGSIFGIDKYFYTIRNIIRTFSNFLLAFLILGGILFYLIKKDKVQPSTLFKNIIIISILINLSWFIIGALLDISTILTISISSLPFRLSINDDKHNILLPYYVLYPGSEQNISSNVKFGFYVDKNNIYSQCPLSGGVFSSLMHQDNVKSSSFVKISSDKCVINIGGIPKVFKISDIDGKTYDYIFNIEPVKVEGYNINTLVQKDFFLGPLEYIYFSIVNFGGIDDLSKQDNKNIAILILIKTVLVLSLFIPLFVFALIMIIRAFFLWIIILFSPILFLFWIFKIKIFKVFDKYSFTSVLSLIFLPVIATFSLSLGIIFFSLMTLSSNYNSLGNITKCDGINGINYEFNISNNNKISICIKEAGSYSYNFDILGWLLKILLGIIILRNTVFFSLKTSSIVSNIVNPIERFSKSLLESVPIIPVPGGIVGIGALRQEIGQVSKVPHSISRSSAYKNLDIFKQN